MIAHVYQLVDPRTAEPFYVGMTRNRTQRLNTHIAGRCPCTAGMVAKVNAPSPKWL